MKKMVMVGISIILIVCGAGLLWADGVLTTALDSPAQIVQARKAMMKAIKANMGDMAQKFEAGSVSAISANALGVAVMAQVMPPLYKETYSDVYGGKGKYFKGAAPADFEAACQSFYTAAQAVAAGAGKNDKSAVAAAMVQVQQSCGACHKAYRGKY